MGFRFELKVKNIILIFEKALKNMHTFHYTIILCLLISQCKSSVEDEYTESLNNLIYQTDSLDQLIASVRIDSFEIAVQITINELEWANAIVSQNDTLHKYLSSIEQYHSVYKGIDSSMIAYTDFYDELHLIHYDLEEIKEQYENKDLTKSEITEIIEQNKLIIDDIALSIEEKIGILLKLKKEVESIHPEIEEMMGIIK